MEDPQPATLDPQPAMRSDPEPGPGGQVRHHCWGRSELGGNAMPGLGPSIGQVAILGRGPTAEFWWKNSAGGWVVQSKIYLTTNSFFPTSGIVKVTLSFNEILSFSALKFNTPIASC